MIDGVKLFIDVDQTLLAKELRYLAFKGSKQVPHIFEIENSLQNETILDKTIPWMALQDKLQEALEMPSEAKQEPSSVPIL